MDRQNVVNFYSRPRIVSRHPSDVALRMAQRRTGISGSSGSQGISGSLTESVASALPSSGGETTPSSGGMSTGQGIQLATTIASSIAQIGVSIYSSQLQKEQAARDAELQKKMLEVQRNQQSLEAYKLLASQQGREMASGVTSAPQADAGQGAMMIAAGVALVALMMLR